MSGNSIQPPAGLGRSGAARRGPATSQNQCSTELAPGASMGRPAPGLALSVTPGHTPTEIKIATLVAGGESTSDIARSLFLSRRTVQAHISHILAKLGATRRVEIVREALRQGISA